MTELYPSDSALAGLSGTTDAEQDVLYIPTGESPYYLSFYKMLYRLLDVSRRAGDLRVFKDGELTFGVRGGNFRDGLATRNYAGSAGNALADDATNYIYLTAAGALVVNQTGLPDPLAVPHLPLAQITTAGGDYAHADVIDLRGPAMFSALHEPGKAAVFNIRDYGAKLDGATDDTAAVNATIAAAQAAGGGIVWHPGGVCRCDGHVVIAAAGGTGLTDPPTQKPLRFLGVGNFSSGQGGGRCDHEPSGGSIYDLRYAGGGTNLAKIASLGFGSVEFAGITLMDSSAGAGTSNPFLVVTNTRAHIHDVTFWGNPAKSGTTCDQDAVVLGGPDNKPADHDWGTAETSPFQGYGTVIEDCHFNRIRRAVFAQPYANGVIIQKLIVWQQCGSNLAGGAAIEVLGHDSDAYSCYGGLVRDCTIECGGYPYPIKLTRCSNWTVGPNGFYDASATTLANVRAESWARFNTVIGGFSGTKPLYSEGANCAPNLVYNNAFGQPPIFGIGSIDSNGSDFDFKTYSLALTYLGSQHLKFSGNIGSGIGAGYDCVGFGAGATPDTLLGRTGAAALRTNACLTVDKGCIFPTADPRIAGACYWNGGTLVKSAG